MADFTSALFLDRRHPAGTVSPWASLTTGRPAAVEESPGALRLAERMARRHGSDLGVLHRSALHALWDTVDMCARAGTHVLLDDAAYPLARWAAAAAHVRGVPVATFAHHDADAADHLVRRRGRPVVLTDGWCPDCNQPAPLAELAAMARDRGGVLVVDDTVAAGVLGTGPTPALPFGRGGGGTMRWVGARPDGVVQLASLAKAYGAPLAVTTGPRELILELRSHGTRWHSSPPSAADVAAGLAATADEHANDARRGIVARLVRALREGLSALGWSIPGAPFPMVSVDGPLAAVRAMYRALRHGGVRTLLRRPRCRHGTVVTFLVTAGHGRDDVEQALAAAATVPPPAARREAS